MILKCLKMATFFSLMRKHLCFKTIISGLNINWFEFYINLVTCAYVEIVINWNGIFS